MLNIWDDDAFSLVSLTESINKLPFKPKRLGEMGLFEAQGIATTTAIIEERSGVLTLLPSVPRGGPATQGVPSKRKVRSFVIPHIPHEDAVKPEAVQNVRAFGSEDALESVTTVVNDKLQDMRNRHEVTEEWLRVGAIQGVVVDGDGTTTLFNLFDEFGVGEVSVDFALGIDTTKVGSKCIEVKEYIEDALGDAAYDHVHALCGREWFMKFVDHPEVKYAYQYYEEGRMLREDPRAGFEYKGIVFEVYRGKIGGKPFIPSNVARFFPVGVGQLFKTFYAPADFMETVNTIGLPIYAKQEPLPFNRGVNIHTQSNPLPICTRPAVLVKGTTSS